MSFQQIYDRVQQLDGRVSTAWLTKQAIELSPFTRIKEQWTGVIDPRFIQGFFIEGPLGPPVVLLDNEGMIVLSRQLDRHRRRFVYTKELMHVFDRLDEKADTPEKFDIQAEKFGNPAVPISPQFKAETKAFWRALAVLCPEHKRRAFKAALNSNETTLVQVATTLQIPDTYARNLFRDEFEGILQVIIPA